MLLNETNIGVEKGKFHITYDFIGNVFRASTRGSSPGNNGFMDQIYNIIGAVRTSTLLTGFHVTNKVIVRSNGLAPWRRQGG